MQNELKIDIRKRARLTRGLLNLLRDDIQCICDDADTNDLLLINESIKEAKDTIQKMTDSIIELEYAVYMVKESSTRN